MFVEKIWDPLNNSWIVILRQLETEEADRCLQAFAHSWGLSVSEGSVALVEAEGAKLTEAAIGPIGGVTVAKEPDKRSGQTVIFTGLSERQAQLLKDCIASGRIFLVSSGAILAIT